MADHRRLSERYAKIGQELIRTEDALAHIRASSATIVYLSSNAERASRGRAVLGQCERVPDRWKWAVPADFAITVFEPNVAGMSEAQLRTLIYHELLHVGISTNRDGDEVYRCVPHDLEDFRVVVERYGLDWDAQKEPVRTD